MKRFNNSIEKVEVSAYRIPTDTPEGDGTFIWNSTTLVLCEIRAGDEVGIGYTYGNKATAVLADELGQKCLNGQSAFDIPSLHASMLEQVRNDGSRGIASMAVSALDIAIWDLKAKLLNCSIVDLLGRATPVSPSTEAAVSRHAAMSSLPNNYPDGRRKGSKASR